MTVTHLLYLHYHLLKIRLIFLHLKFNDLHLKWKILKYTSFFVTIFAYSLFPVRVTFPFFFQLQRRFTGRNLPFLGFTYLWNELTNSSSETNYFFPSLFATPSVAVCDRRRTDYFNVRYQ